jgi:hypothetical protein
MPLILIEGSSGFPESHQETAGHYLKIRLPLLPSTYYSLSFNDSMSQYFKHYEHSFDSPQYRATQSAESQLMFQRNTLPPSSRTNKQKPALS